MTYNLKYISTDKYKSRCEEFPQCEENSFVVYFKDGFYARVGIKFDNELLLMYNPSVEIFNIDIDCYGKDFSATSFAFKRSINSVPTKELRDICSTPLLAMNMALANLSFLRANFDKNYSLSKETISKSKNTQQIFKDLDDDDDDGGVKILAAV